MIEALVIGGGPAGAAVATRLAQGGRHVELLEREAGPVHKVCGEFLSREAALYVASLGLNLTDLGSVPIDRLRFSGGARVTTVGLPFSAVSLSRYVFDEALLREAGRAGATVKRSAKVVSISRTSHAWNVRLANDELLEAKTVFLATGKHDLRSQKRPLGLQNDLIAFKLHFALAEDQARELSRHVELYMFRGGYAGLQAVEGGRANLCLVVRRSRLASLGHRFEHLLQAMRKDSPLLDSRLASAERLWQRPVALSAIPYGHVQRHSDGLWRLGDQAAVIPSFSGDGMSVALHSAELAASTYLAGGTPNAYQERLAKDVSTQVRLATLLSHALVRRPAQVALGAAARVWPQLMSSVAFHTRISDAALARTVLGSQL